VEDLPKVNTEPSKEVKIQYARDIFNKAGVPDTEYFIKMISECENSTWGSTRTNTNQDKTTDHGVTQINDYWHKERFTKMFGSWDKVYNWKNNIEYALYLRLSWKNYSAWTCSSIVKK